MMGGAPSIFNPEKLAMSSSKVSGWDSSSAAVGATDLCEAAGGAVTAPEDEGVLLAGANPAGKCFSRYDMSTR